MIQAFLGASAIYMLHGCASCAEAFGRLKIDS